MAINFFSEGVKVQIPRVTLKKWIIEVIKTEKFSISDINIIFCTDEYLLKINRDFLNHDYFTDIITFDYTSGGTISGELYISYDRICENAARLRIPEQTELLRVIIHGIYHLCGYDDNTKSLRRAMTDKENEGLKIWEQLKGENPGKLTM